MIYRNNFSTKYFLFVFFIFVGGSYARIPPITEFKLAGTHTFQNAKAKSWTVTQELIDENDSSFSESKENFLVSKGSKFKINLPKVKNKETIYHIIAEGENFSQKYKVRVFEPNKISSFYYKSELNPALKTYFFVPSSLSSKTRVLLVMHGLSRNADVYIASWNDWAKKNDYIIIAPNFDEKNWTGSRMYNLGNIFTKEDLKKNRAKWSFQLVEDIHKTAKEGFGLARDNYDIFGHSAGGQFVHRFMFIMSEANVRLAITANAGWYTLPDLSLEYPYGYKHPKFSYTNNDLMEYSKRNIFIMRGTDDTERTANLRQTPEADEQGKNRFERAGFMFERIKAINSKTNWRLIDAPKVGHDQKRMAVAAQLVLDMINAQNK